MKQLQKRKAKGRIAKSVLRLPDLEVAKSAVLSSLSCPDAQRGYRHAIDEFVDWYCSSFYKTVVIRYRLHLDSRLQGRATAGPIWRPALWLCVSVLPHHPWPPPATSRSCPRRHRAQSGLRVILSKLLTFYCSPELRNGSFAVGITLTRATLLELILLHTHPSLRDAAR